MMCKICGSMAINEHMHGREPGYRADLCDVCYWREECAKLRNLLDFNQGVKESLLERATRAEVRLEVMTGDAAVEAAEDSLDSNYDTHISRWMVRDALAAARAEVCK